MTQDDTQSITKIKLTVTLIEDGVAWFESDDQLTTADVPVLFSVDDRMFEITTKCESYLYHDPKIGQYFVAKQDDKVLTLYLTETDEGLMIESGYIFNIVTKH